jgi:hypothetical protein
MLVLKSLDHESWFERRLAGRVGAAAVHCQYLLILEHFVRRTYMSARLKERWACYEVLADLRMLAGAESGEAVVRPMAKQLYAHADLEPSDGGDGLKHPASLRSVAARRD